MTIALNSAPDAKRVARKAKRIQHFYHAKGSSLFQRDASTDHLDVLIMDCGSEDIASAVAFQLNRGERYRSVIQSFDDRLTKAYGSPIERTVHPELAFVWRSARLELELAEKDET